MLCGGSRSTDLVVGYDRMVARTEEYPYTRCRDCGLVALASPPSPEDIPSLYPADYSPLSSQRAAHEHRAMSRTWINRIAIRFVYATTCVTEPLWLRRLCGPLSGRVLRGLLEPRGKNRLLDVGCGSGRLLARHRELGWDVHGVELSAEGVRICREAGLDVQRGSLFDVDLPRRHFDAIVLNHVVEHLADPIAVLERAAEHLAEDGVLVLHTPNAKGIGFSLYKSCWYPLDAPRHFYLFDPHTIRLLGERAGLRLRGVAAQSAPRLLCESRHYARTQGPVLPPGLDARRAILARSRETKQPYHGFRRIVRPLTWLLALLGRGDRMEARFELGSAGAGPAR